MTTLCRDDYTDPEHTQNLQRLSDTQQARIEQLESDLSAWMRTAEGLHRQRGDIVAAAVVFGAVLGLAVGYLVGGVW